MTIQSSSFQEFLNRSLPGIMLILLAGFLAYANTFQVPFVLDDKQSIVENEYLRSLDSFYGGTPTRTLAYFSFALNYQLGGLEVTGYHVVNLLIHLSAALLVYWLVRLTFRTPHLRGSRLVPRAGLLALLAALIFAVHPVQIQAVTYIVQRLASLATMFYLLSVVLYVLARLNFEAKGKRQKAKSSEGIGPWTSSLGPFLLAGSVLTAILAMKTKEISFTLPFAILLYELFFFQGIWKRRLLYLMPILATLPVVPLTVLGSGESTGESIGDFLADAGEQTRAHTSMSRLDYLFTQFRVIVTYLRLLVLPLNQNLDYDYPLYTTFLTPPVFLSFLLLAALLGLAVYLYWKTRQASVDGGPWSVGSRQLTQQSFISDPGPSASGLKTDPALRLISFGILWFFLALAVESSVVPILDVIFEHRLYLPSFGAAVAFVTFFFLVAERLTILIGIRLPIIIAGLIVLILSISTFQRNHIWGDDIRLWADVVSKSPKKSRPHNELGVALENGGRRLEAMESFRRAIAIDPYHYKAHHNLGDLYLVSGYPDRALPLLQAAISIKPDLEEAYVKFGAALLRSRQFRETAIFLEQNLDRIGENGEARFYLGAAYAFLGNSEAAQRELTVVSRLDPALAADLAGLLGMGAKMMK